MSPFPSLFIRAAQRRLLMTAAVAVLLLAAGQSSISAAQTTPPAPPQAAPTPLATPLGTQAAAETLAIRLGTHTGYTRLVFDFPQLTAYRVEDSGTGTARLVFSTPLTPRALPPASAEITAFNSTRPTPDTLAITLTLAPGATLKHYRLMRRVVVDVLAKPAVKPVAPPKEKIATTPAPAPTAPIQASTPPPAPVTLAAAPVSDAAPPAPVSAVSAVPAAPAEPTTITLATVSPAKLAVFSRHDTLWLVLEGSAASAAVPTVIGPDAAALGAPRPLTFAGGRAYRYTLPQDRVVTVSRKGMMWEVTLGQDLRENAPTANLTVVHDTASDKSKLLIDMKDPGDILTLQDPTVGDTLMVVPTASPQSRIESDYRYANVAVMAAETGLVVNPLADDVTMTRLGSFITVTAGSGVAATPGATQSSTLVDTATGFTPGESKALFDFSAWTQGGWTKLNDNRRTIESRIASAKTPDSKQEETLRLALLYFANGFGHETLGILRMLSDDDPDMLKNPNILALRGAAAAMAGHYDEALSDLTDPAIQQHPDVRLWTGYVAAASEQWRRADQAFPRDGALVAQYPPVIAIPMTIYMAESALRLGHVDSAQQLLDNLTTLPIKDYPHYDAAIGYLRGEAARQSGRFDEAMTRWSTVAGGLDRRYHTKASLALTQLELQEKKITPAQAVDRLDSLRFAWRGDGLEVQTLAALGRTRILNKQYLDGLNDLRAAAALADQLRDDSTPIRQDMAQIVASLFSGDEKIKLNPLEAVSIYSDYESLLPEGAAGAAAVLNFADYLIGMDLLDRAAGLITRVLDDTTDAQQRAEIGTRLATVYLLDSKPSLALDALSRTDDAARSADADLVTRRILLTARAQSQLNRIDEAIATLVRIDSVESRRLTADVLWRARRWREAAAAIETLLPTTVPATLDDDMARLVMNAAVGYKLAGDGEGLRTLRAAYANQMAATTLGPTFSVVTRDGGTMSLSDRDTILRLANEVDLFKSLLESFKATTHSSTSPAAPPAN